MFEDMRRSVQVYVLVDARRKMSVAFTSGASITKCTRKFIHNARTEPLRERIFQVEQVLNFERRKIKLDINRFKESIDEFTHSFLCYTRETANVGDLKIKLR